MSESKNNSHNEDDASPINTEDLKRRLDVIFTLARIKQVELTPENEQALIKIIETKREVIKIITALGSENRGPGESAK